MIGHRFRTRLGGSFSEDIVEDIEDIEDVELEPHVEAAEHPKKKKKGHQNTFRSRI